MSSPRLTNKGTHVAIMFNTSVGMLFKLQAAQMDRRQRVMERDVACLASCRYIKLAKRHVLATPCSMMFVAP
jgi:hypothetical protein